MANRNGGHSGRQKRVLAPALPVNGSISRLGRWGALYPADNGWQSPFTDGHSTKTLCLPKIGEFALTTYEIAEPIEHLYDDRSGSPTSIVATWHIKSREELCRLRICFLVKKTTEMEISIDSIKHPTGPVRECFSFGVCDALESLKAEDTQFVVLTARSGTEKRHLVHIKVAVRDLESSVLAVEYRAWNPEKESARTVGDSNSSDGDS